MGAPHMIPFPLLLFTLSSLAARPAQEPAQEPVRGQPIPAGHGDSAEASDAAPSFEALLDAFHAARPGDPAALRDARVRAELAPRSLPVLAGLVRWTAKRQGFEAITFEVYALALGDPERGATVVARLDAHEPLTAAVARTLVAVDFDEDELGQLLVRLEDDRLAESRASEAAEARHDPRNWIGSRLTFSGVTPDGGTFSTASWRGEVGVVVFWASWCKPCEVVLDSIAAARERHGAHGLRVLGVSCDLDATELRAHLDAHPRQDWPQLFDPASPGWHELAVAHDVHRIPTAFVLGRAGSVHDVVRSADELDRALARLFAERPR